MASHGTTIGVGGDHVKLMENKQFLENNNLRGIGIHHVFVMSS